MTLQPPVLLVSMPFAPLYAPSLGLTVLQGQLRRTGVDVNVRYFSIDFAASVGEDLYNKIGDDLGELDLLGEWLFSAALFDRNHEDVEGFVRRNIAARWSDAPDPAVLDGIVGDIVRARSSIVPFLDRVISEIVASDARIVGFTSVFQQHVASLATARRLKAARPDTYIVFGGANCELPMGLENLRQFPFIDAVVSGEGEIAFQRLVEDVLVHGEVQAAIPGVHNRQATATRAGGCATHESATVPLSALRRATEPGADRVDPPASSNGAQLAMDDLPFPDFTQFLEQARGSGIRMDKVYLLFESSRGCWWGEKHHCTFCGLNGGTMAYRSKSGPRVVDELKWLYEQFGVRRYAATDNILDAKYFETFLPALAEARLPIELFYEIKSNLKKNHLLALRNAGVIKIQPGIESFSTDILRTMRKGVTGLQNVQTLKWCRELGLVPVWNILWGFPDEDPVEYERMARLAPLLEHLAPPNALLRLTMERFSPNFVQSTELGFSNVRATRAYGYIYPFSDEVLFNLSYYFDYDVQERERPDVAALAKAMEKWQGASDSELVAIDRDRELTVIDLRSISVERLRVLTEVERAILLTCDEIRSRDGVRRAVARELGPSAAEEIPSALDRLQAANLMVSEGDNLLSLPVLIGPYSAPRPIIKLLVTLMPPAARAS